MKKIILISMAIFSISAIASYYVQVQIEDYKVDNYNSNIDLTEKEIINLILLEKDGSYKFDIESTTYGDDGVDCNTTFKDFEIVDFTNKEKFEITFTAEQSRNVYGCGMIWTCLTYISKTEGQWSTAMECVW